VYCDTAEVCGVRDYTKGESAIAVAHQFSGRQWTFARQGQGLWTRGCAVSTLGFELEQLKAYSGQQERVDSEEDAVRF